MGSDGVDGPPCVDMSDLFFHHGANGPYGDADEYVDCHRCAEAKALCAKCPNRGPCLEYALDTRQHNGVWGGVDEKERRRMLRRNPRSERLGDAPFVLVWH